MQVSYSKNIKSLIEEIDVSESDYKKAVSRYESISNFFSNSDLATYQPKVLTQGSFKIGTPIKPLTETGSYDIDMVITLQSFKKNEITQHELKEAVGNVLKEYAKQNGMSSIPKDGKRCWTLKYVDGHNFHLDILPTIPNSTVNENELAFTDKRNSYYNRISNEWNITNPEDYYQWFRSISKYSDYLSKYAIRNKADIEKIPEYKIKTPLQRIIQVLKRHAEIMFADNKDYKPSSIIITTLATKAYSHIIDSNYTFNEIIKCIINGLQAEIDNVVGKQCVLNPVDRRENLSSKWENQIYYDYFIKWVDQLKFDFSTNNSLVSLDEEFKLIKRSLTNGKPSIYQLQNIVDSLPYHRKMMWENQIWKNVVIKCYLVKNKKRIREIHSGERVSKGLDIQFIAHSDNIYLYKVFWQITNTGYEAMKLGQLRGDFYNSEIIEGSQVRNESTSYFGKHYAEAFLIDNNNKCVGRSYPFEVNID